MLTEWKLLFLDRASRRDTLIPGHTRSHPFTHAWCATRTVCSPSGGPTYVQSHTKALGLSHPPLPTVPGGRPGSRPRGTLNLTPTFSCVTIPFPFLLFFRSIFLSYDIYIHIYIYFYLFFLFKCLPPLLCKLHERRKLVSFVYCYILSAQNSD